ncbi:MAG: hypothetical protein H8E55_40510 [Pelagibacterales bacterium]|nr:hypothetical protein [Pelagibacterales bacterium]
MERKNRKRKNPNVHVLQYFGLYNKYHLLDYQMSKGAFRCQVSRTYDKITAITNKTRVRDQEEKNKIFTMY